MADEEQLRLLKQGVGAWNDWRRKQGPDTYINLSEADLREADLRRADLREANLSGAYLGRADLIGALLINANLSGADLSHANLSSANLDGAHLIGANLSEAKLFEAHLGKANLSEAKLFEADLSHAYLGRADLDGANLSEAKLFEANLSQANLSEAKLFEADLPWVNLIGANLSQANLSGARLTGADLSEANLSGADLPGANLNKANLTEADLSGADLTGCRVYGVSAWGLTLSEGTKQQGLIITPHSEPEVTTDDIEVAQFLYLLIHNEKLRKVIDTITTKVVLILGRFSEERKVVLDAVRDALRTRDLLPVIFDFSVPASRDVTETVRVVASLARFVVADITDATEVRSELNFVSDFPSLPVQPILLRGRPEPVGVPHWRRYPWFLPSFEYDTVEHLLANLNDCVITPAEAKARQLQGHSHEPAPDAATAP